MDSLDDVVTAFMKLKDVEGIHEAARWGPAPVLSAGAGCERGSWLNVKHARVRALAHTQDT